MGEVRIFSGTTQNKDQCNAQSLTQGFNCKVCMLLQGALKCERGQGCANFPHPSDENEISRYIITTCSNIQVMRIKQVTTQGRMS